MRVGKATAVTTARVERFFSVLVEIE